MNKIFIKQSKDCPTAANVYRFAPDFGCNYHRIIPIKGGWWVFYNEEEADQWEKEHFDEII